MHLTHIFAAADAAALQAALALPQFAGIHALVPGLQRALDHPQPDLAAHLSDISAVLDIAQDNSRHPEDWNNLQTAVDATRTARESFLDAARAAAVDAPAVTLYAMVCTRHGTLEAPKYAEDLCVGFDEACAALRTWANTDFDNKDGWQLAEYLNSADQQFCIQLTAPFCGSPNRTYRVQAVMTSPARMLTST